MRRRKSPGRKKPVRKPALVPLSVLVDPAKVALVRKALGLRSDAEVLRVALDHLLSHFHGGEEE